MEMLIYTSTFFTLIPGTCPLSLIQGKGRKNVLTYNDRIISISLTVNHLIFTLISEDNHSYSHFTDGKLRQSDYMICPRSYSWQVTELDLEHL